MSERDPAMTLDDYQRGALRTLNPSLDERDRLLDASAGLAEEAAEVLGLIRKRAFQGKEVDQARLTEELGDVLWCLACRRSFRWRFSVRSSGGQSRETGASAS
jgi:hypothetical protein